MLAAGVLKSPATVLFALSHLPIRVIPQDMAGEPRTEYELRRRRANDTLRQAARQFVQIGNARLGVAVVAVTLLWLGLGSHAVSLRWIAVPLGAFVALMVWQQAVLRRRTLAAGQVAYYANAINRVDDRWAGQGDGGDRFRVRDHVFADDLDVFGAGSLFELVSRARTTAGAALLAQWLLEPAEAVEVLARQEAVRELTAAVDLREDFHLLGQSFGSAVQVHGLKAWAERSHARFPRRAVFIAISLALLGLGTIFAFFAYQWPLFPFLLVFAADLVFAFIIRSGVTDVLANVDAPAQDLAALSGMLGRLEREQFRSEQLSAMAHSLHIEGRTASERIASLRRWVELVDSADHVILRIIGPVLHWKPLLAFAVNRWHRQNAGAVGGWLKAIADFEVLSSLAQLSYERPAWVFPQLLAEGKATFRARGMKHPLLSAVECQPNSVELGTRTDLMIISGSNMSGKSTLLRAVGLNSVLAWCGAPVPALSLSLAAMRLGASIRVADSLQDHRSRFFAEISRLRQIVDLTKGERSVLFLLDELLSGTNSHDRRIGAGAVLRTLVHAGAIGMVTTHDLALTEVERELPGTARNVHFLDEMVGGEMHFDYRLREGVVTHSNALELMRAVGLIV